MKMSLPLTTAAALVLALSACSNSKDGATASVITPEVQGAIEVAQEGSKTTLSAGVERFTNDITVDGKAGVVTADVVSGAGPVLVETRFGNTKTDYVLTAQADAKIATPGGDYEGPLSVTYRTADTGAFSTAKGDILLTLDGEFGDLDFSGRASNDKDTFQIIGDGIVEKGTLTSDYTGVNQLDSDGNRVANFEGALNGVIVKGDNTPVVAGLVSVDEPGLTLDGGFVAGKSN